MAKAAPTPEDRGAVDDDAGAVQLRASAHLIQVPEAARITGLPRSKLRKSFTAEHKRPKNVPAPPPHRRIGRSIYILADKLPAWVESLGDTGTITASKRRRGRPTVAERIARRQNRS